MTYDSNAHSLSLTACRGHSVSWLIIMSYYARSTIRMHLSCPLRLLTLGASIIHHGQCHHAPCPMMSTVHLLWLAACPPKGGRSEDSGGERYPRTRLIKDLHDLVAPQVARAIFVPLFLRCEHRSPITMAVSRQRGHDVMHVPPLPPTQHLCSLRSLSAATTILTLSFISSCRNNHVQLVSSLRP
jgi:hypothetical protein